MTGENLWKKKSKKCSVENDKKMWSFAKHCKNKWAVKKTSEKTQVF